MSDKAWEERVREAERRAGVYDEPEEPDPEYDTIREYDEAFSYEL